MASSISSETEVAGVDGCRRGWVVVRRNMGSRRWEAVVLDSFTEVVAATVDCTILAVDMPIGIPEAATAGGRACDAAARALLGPGRTGSVFSPPCRAALACDVYTEALAANRASGPAAPGLSIQAFNIFAKIREVERVMTPTLQQRVREVHPELAFRALNGGMALAAGKKTPAGHAQRRGLLARAGFLRIRARLPALRRAGAQADDVLDACAACWSAERMALHSAERLPICPESDARGLRMEIWF